MTVPHYSRSHALALDAASPLADRRALFDLPDEVSYLCGNSLGALPRAVPSRVAEAVQQEWGRQLVGAWNSAGWTTLAERAATRISALIGARPEDVNLSDSTSVTLFKLLVAGARLRPDRRVLMVEPTTFPTDGYVAAGVARTLGLEVRWCDPADPAAALDEDVAVLCLTHVDFRTGAMYDLPAITAAAHDSGVIMLWDLCHSAGAVPVDLAGAGADLAVGCTYKYLNGGPGSPAFGYVAPVHQDVLDQPVTGWWGHAEPFAMTRDYSPASGIRRLTVGTPPVLALTALDAALTVFDDVSPGDLRAQSLSLTDLFIDLVDARLPGLEVVTPRDHGRRGSHVSLRHPAAYGIVQALIARGVVGDFRTPDIARFGLAPLYVRHVDVYDAVDQLAAVLESAEHERPEYRTRLAVT